MEWQSSDNKCNPTGLCGSNAYCTLVDQVTACACPPVYKNQECRKHKLPLRFGKTEQNKSVATYIKMRIGEFGGKERGIEPKAGNDLSTKNKNELHIGILITGVSCLSVGLIVISISAALIFRHRARECKAISNEASEGLVIDVTLGSFTYEDLERTTNGFKEKLGRGAFGTVFKGALLNGQTTIAVKKLEKVMAGGVVEFQNEIRSIGRTHHRNLVRQFGYCLDKSNMLLVYEYMKNGSPTDFLFKSETKPNCEDRIRIAWDISRGIHYLHKECETQIIHCDIISKNILMDEHWRAKISDFGLAKLLMPDQSKTLTGIRGTRGYVGQKKFF
ncbi:G-type lectin S-receptor-like serine/threonine-protein kinase LECRK4 [Hevea brasiliensis]|uniref:G-type lectin S-receptor-like serine/threonine-protein kinase LECRK4 n=1 Tax=Hevea brasiliensis TaxID=3981 RepID=UPI0025D1EF23|nr:G-type lectin S-receptor-like serine/threonine-protein kinase LECRK4 [Hevea brasiliensis]